MPTSLTEKVLKTIKQYDMIASGDRVLAAVSGGPDSVFLLQSLNYLKKKLGIRSIAVCHLEHGLRGKQSKDDLAFVKKIAEAMGLEFVHKSVKLATKVVKGLSTEEVARQERYSFFKEAAEKVGASVIATGHTLDDQAETILMRLVKGASLKGIVGISPVRQHGELRIIRPLLEIEKREISAYLDDSGAAYRIDHTNLEPIYFRNVVRSQILPFLEKYNPRLKRSLFNLAEHLREDFEFIDKEKAKARLCMRPGKGGTVEISLKDMVVQPKTLQKELLRDALDKVGGEVKKLTFRHWKDLEQFIKHKRKGSSIDLPGSIRVSRTESSLRFHRI